VPDNDRDHSVLDNPVWASLHGAHRQLAERNGAAARYPVTVSPFAAVDGDDGWSDLCALLGPGVRFGMIGAGVRAPDGWQIDFAATGVQLVATDAVDARPFDEAVVLGPADVPEMLDLVERTRPGPFLAGTYRMGRYLGVRRDGRLAAMAGERLHPPGWTEVSAVCTDPDFRGQGLGTRLVQAVTFGIRERGEQAMMHAAGSNAGAIRLYEALGFRIRCEARFFAARTPQDEAS
jgi:ribosomal protein S18 acetylase RimI-like enzyme